MVRELMFEAKQIALKSEILKEQLLQMENSYEENQNL